MFNFEVKGFKEIERNLDKLKKRAEELNGETKIPMDELLSSSFLKKYSPYNSLEEMLDKSPFIVNNQDDFKKIDDKEWDKFINKNTKFNSWNDMLKTAMQIWTAKKLGLK